VPATLSGLAEGSGAGCNSELGFCGMSGKSGDRVGGVQELCAHKVAEVKGPAECWLRRGRTRAPVGWADERDEMHLKVAATLSNRHNWRGIRPWVGHARVAQACARNRHPMTHIHCKLSAVDGFVLKNADDVPLVSLTYESAGKAVEAHALMAQAIQEAIVTVHCGSKAATEAR
jgi:hypothetical protein